MKNSYEVIVFVDAACLVAASVYGLPHVALLNFFFLIFSEISEPTCLKFGHNAWIGPE